MSDANVAPGKRSKGAGCLRWLGRVALWGVILLLVLVATGAIYQGIASARDARLYKPVDQMVDVDGIQMRLDCRGTGSPTVVLEAGGQSWSTHWALVQDDVAEFTRVCSYDRAGSGWSESVKEDLSPQVAVEMLHALLKNGGERPPYLMVGHSFGGVFIRTYAAQYPDEVVGMVLVDSSHDEQYVRLPSEFTQAPEVQQSRKQMMTQLSVFMVAERLGLFRAFKLYDPGFASLQFSEQDKALLLVEMYRTGYIKSARREMDMMEAYEKQPAEIQSLGDRPLISLARKVDVQDMLEQIPSSLQSMELAQQLADIANGMQEELAALSSRGELIIVEDTGHNIQIEKPQVVIDAIREVFEQIPR